MSGENSTGGGLSGHQRTGRRLETCGTTKPGSSGQRGTSATMGGGAYAEGAGPEAVGEPDVRTMPGSTWMEP